MSVQEHVGTITQKGQVTIPLAVRKLLGVAPYDRVTFRVVDGHVELLPARMTLEATYGAVRARAHPENWKTMRRQTREERARYRVGKIRQRKGSR